MRLASRSKIASLQVLSKILNSRKCKYNLRTTSKIINKRFNNYRKRFKIVIRITLSFAKFVSSRKMPDYWQV